MVTGEGRGDSALFCGGAGAKAVKPSDYATFMREAFRGSLEARYTVRNLGFRCAGAEKPTPPAQRADVGRHGSESLYNLKATWRDASGRRVSLSSLEGSVVVLAMIYTSCMGICPMTVTDMKRIESALPDADRRKVRFVLVSFDPKRDAPETLDAYATTRALPKEAWTLLTGDEDGVRELAAAVGMRLKPTPSGDFVHSTVISVLDEKGVVAAQQKGLGEDPAPTVATLRKLLER
jgi:protein SCO1/2